MIRRNALSVLGVAAVCAAASLAFDAIPQDAKESAPQVDPCRPSRLEAARQVVVNERLELELPDGRIIRLAGVEAPPARRADLKFMASAAEDLALWTAAPISVFIFRPQPDRWQRHDGRAFVAEVGGAPDLLPSLSEAIIDAGLARVDPSTERRPCLDRLYAAEARARNARRGLWEDPVYAVIDAADAEVKAHAGAMAIVQGRVASVRARRGVTYVNLGDGSPQSPALTLGREAIRAMEREGMKPEALSGRRIRARGVLDLRDGPRIEVYGPSAVELLPAGS